mmetsp:Transcript_19276/g.37486  ORF Transcript_19276/g.37486 Transcript_19276/m.37486 type:complete len:379 (-) Transcript_19276:304-1440(-)
MLCDADALSGLASFSVSLFTLLCDQNPTDPALIVSPLSIASALALSAAGATPAGKAGVELNKLLQVQSHSHVAYLVSSLLAGKTSSSGVEVHIANSVWTKASIKESYVSLVRDVHDAKADVLSETYDPINQWVKESTHGRIEQLLAGVPDPLVVALLVNAVFFKGSWASKFDPQLTAESKFHTQDGPVTAKFMNRKAKMLVDERADELGGATVLRLDYGVANSDFCALFVLPATHSPNSLLAATKGLKDLSISSLLLRQREQMVHLRLPRFRAEWGVASLKKALRELGLKESFDGVDEFTNMSDDPDVHIDDVLHKAVIEVNEEGTVAAAATAAVMVTRSLPPPPIELSFDRPFLMLVVHAKTGMPVFVGRFIKPDLN